MGKTLHQVLGSTCFSIRKVFAQTCEPNGEALARKLLLAPQQALPQRRQLAVEGRHFRHFLHLAKCDSPRHATLSPINTLEPERKMVTGNPLLGSILIGVKGYDTV